jgi:glycosyltransferase involved in cell wall biosynthesis
VVEPKPLKLSVLIPVWNEQASVEDIVRRVAGMDVSHLGVPVELEIICVDDFSTDQSGDILRRLHGGPAEAPGEGPRQMSPVGPGGPGTAGSGEETEGRLADAQIPGLRVIRHPFNQGKGAGIRTALAAATGDYCIIQDADYEYDPADIPRLLEPIVKGKATVVYGARPLDGSGGRLIMDAGNRALTILTNLLYGTRLHDMETCYKLLPTGLLRAFNLECSRFDMEPEITAKVKRSGHDIFEIPISYFPRPPGQGGKGGKKLSARKDGLPALMALLRYRFWKPPTSGQSTPIGASASARA